MDLKEFRLRPMEDKDIEMVLSWRNHDDVRSKMYDSKIIPLEDHLRWYEKIKTQNDRVCLIFEHLEKPIGVSCRKFKNKRKQHLGLGLLFRRPRAHSWFWVNYGNFSDDLFF